MLKITVLLEVHREVNTNDANPAVTAGYFDFFSMAILSEHIHNRFTVLLKFVRDYLGEQVPER